MRPRSERYVGLAADRFGGMTDLGRHVRDAQVFGIVEESEGCEGWSRDQMQNLIDQVNQAWDEHGGLVSTLSVELRERHARIHGEAVRRAREAGWSGELELENDS